MKVKVQGKTKQHNKKRPSPPKTTKNKLNHSVKKKQNKTKSGEKSEVASFLQLGRDTRSKIHQDITFPGQT